MVTPNGYRAVKIDMTRPFFVKRHVSVYSNTFIAFVKMDIGKSLVILELPPLWLVTKNRFWSLILWQLKNFNHQACGDRNFSIATRLAIEKISSPSFQCDTMALPFRWKNILKPKNNYGNSNISPWKNIILKKNHLKETKFLQDITILLLIPSFYTNQNM
jgi:hypothetical protein